MPVGDARPSLPSRPPRPPSETASLPRAGGQSRAPSWLVPLLVPFTVHLLGVALLGDWIIDDAGISYAYARNLASGHGFVSQPGRPPVEGFSNFLWVVLLVPSFVLRLFDPVWAPKVLGAALVLGSFASIQRTLRRSTGDDVLGLLVTLLVAAAPPVVIWTSSGLENGLTLFLVTALYSTAVERPGRWQIRCGAIAGLLAMTRPDGLLYGALGVLLATGELATRRPVRAALRGLASHALGLAAVFTPFLVFRLARFGLPWPHPYYAKRLHLSLSDSLLAMARDPAAVERKLVDLAQGIGGPAGPALLALTALGALWLALRGRLPRHVAMAVTLQAIAVGAYLWMDPDWMGEYRFATGAVLLSILSFVAVARAAAAELRERLGPRILGRPSPPSACHSRARCDHALSSVALAKLHAVPLAGALLVAAAFATFFPRTVAFASRPPTPYADIERSFARKLDAYADILGIEQGSVLLPDVGAMLFGSRLTVYDAAGLCEPEVIRTLKQGTVLWLDSHPEFHDHVFEELRPTFISTHHFWTHVTAFDEDPRFDRDYVAIDAHEDTYVKRVFGRRLRSGDFVRRDALADFGRIEVLRAVYRAPPRPDPLVVRLADVLRPPLPKERAAAIAELREAADGALLQGDPNRAATLLGRLLQRDPADLDAAAARAAALDSALRPDEARREWKRVRDLASSTGGSIAAIAAARLEGHLFPPRSVTNVPALPSNHE